MRLGPAAAAVLLAACSSKPSGFSSHTGPEDRWTLPLVGAMEDGLLLTPVSIGSRGPFLFLLDPDAPVSVVDGDLVKQLGVLATQGPQPYDETGGPQQRLYVQLFGLEIGSLIVEKQRAIVVKANTFDAAGRRIHGVLGADVLGAVVFGFDRDLGTATLIETGSFKPPANAIALPYQVIGKNLPVVGRRVAKAQIGDEQFDLHLDLGSTASQLRDTEWARAKLTSRDIKGIVVDEVGTPRKVEKASEPIDVALGSVTGKVVFLPYGDQRWAEHEVAGTLGLGFFTRYDVWANFRAKSLYLVPREPHPVAKRIARWETGALDKCVAAGCATVRLIDPLAGKQLEEGKQHPGVILSLTREAKAGGMPLEVVIEPSRPELPLVIANLPAHVDRLIDQLPPTFVGATLSVIDASPYPRECPTKNGCVDKLAR